MLCAHTEYVMRKYWICCDCGRR